jgi:hypothetical protein
LEKRTVLDRVEIDSTGHVYMRLLKQVVDGDKVLMSEPHRSVIAPGVEPKDQVALVSEHLQEMGFPPVEAPDLAKLASFTQIVMPQREAFVIAETARMAEKEKARVAEAVKA